MAAKGLVMDFQQSQSISREEVEKNLIFLGFLIVKNKLKEKTKESLIKYDEADLRMVMATGDNILTAICVSKECNLINKNQEMFSCELDKSENGKEVMIWNKIEGNDEEEENSSGEMNNSLNSLNKNSNKDKNNEITQLNESKSNISLYELYPPEKINASNKPSQKIE